MYFLLEFKYSFFKIYGEIEMILAVCPAPSLCARLPHAPTDRKNPLVKLKE